MAKIKSIDTLSPGFAAGDFENIYKEYFERLYRYASVITKSNELAKDVVSEVFLNLWNNRMNIPEIKKLDSYLFVSVKNLVLKTFTKHRPNWVSHEHEDVLNIAERIDPAGFLIANELEKVLDQAVHSLPSQCALIFRMVKIEGMSYDEVSKELDIAVGTVKNQMIKALARIRRHLAIHFDIKEPVDDQHLISGILHTWMGLLLCYEIFK